MKHASLVLALLLAIATARAEISDGVVRIGVLNDISGVFQDYNGPGSVAAARMAAEDFAASNPGLRIEIVQGDHQNRPDVGSSIARRWLDIDRVDAVVDVPNSAVALAINEIFRGSRMTLLASSTATSDLTGKACSPNTVQWVTDSWAIARSTGAAMRARGGETWFLVAVDFALGAAIVRDTTEFLAAGNARVLGVARHPLGTADFSSVLLQARASKAQVIALANAGPDTANAVKQAAEFGILRAGSGQQIVGMLTFINDIHALGLEAAQGLLVTEAFYWDLDDGTRAFARRYAERMGGRMPSTNQAGVYSATLAYLQAVRTAGSDDAKQAVPALRRAPIADKLFGEVTVRPDGRAVHAMHLFEVKKPAESRGAWDYYKLVSTVPAEAAFRPMAEGGCPLLR